ncbi:MAG TPA: sigma 54-interacting transcriptional regulator [Chitinispirillaceae bacterium]|nr:sigma 54-interacting transcriptional regulator [Chitinispirillaceae bacterium]
MSKDTCEKLLIELQKAQNKICELKDSLDYQKVRHLRESERKYRKIFEESTDYIFTISFDGYFISANKSALTKFGYSSEEISRIHFLDLIDSSFHSLIKEISNKKQPVHTYSEPYELLSHTRNGENVWIEVRTRIISENNQLSGIQVVAHNITERKKGDEELRESRQRFMEIAELLPGIICEMDLSFRLTYVNKMGLKTFGFTEDDYKRGINVSELIPDDMLEKKEVDMYNLCHGDYGNPVLYTLRKKDKTPIYVIINSAPIVKDNDVVGMRTCIIDISDRVIAEKKLRLSEERFRTIYAESPIGIALFSSEGYMIDKNRSFKNMFAIKNDTEIHLFIDVSIPVEKKEKLLNGEGISLEQQIKSDTGIDSRYYDWAVTPIGIQELGPSVFLAQVQDITEKKLAQELRIKKEREATARAEAMVAGLRRELLQKATFNNMVSRSPQMKKIFEILPQIANAAANVLVCGESGTGKELIAKSLHEMSCRKNKPFIAINCSALPDNLLESELFGYKSGAFTDAKRDKPGKFALAEGGTIFLDEIGDISSAMQVKLLRVIQEKTYEPLGGISTVTANVRIIAATNKDLPSMVKNGEFREDLYYRINVVTITLPALKDRRCDIPLLVEHFISIFNARYGKSIQGIADSTLERLLAYDFPGNIRELQNIIEHAFIFCKEPVIEQSHLPGALKDTKTDEINAVSRIKNLSELERIYIKSILEESGGNKVKAAQRLGIHKATLFRKMKQLGLTENFSRQSTNS